MSSKYSLHDMFAHTQHAVREYMKISEKRTKKTDVKLSKFDTSS